MSAELLDDPLAPLVASVGVDREMCQSAATCLAYNIYELDEEAKAVLLTNNGSNSDTPGNPLATAEGFVDLENLLNTENMDREKMQQLVIESAKSCPFNAIIVKDKEGKQIWPEII